MVLMLHAHPACRWAAATALKELRSYPEGGACVVMPEVRDSRGHVGGGVVRLPASSTTAGAAVLALAEAEALRGRHDKALEAALQVGVCSGAWHTMLRVFNWAPLLPPF